jgi:hypothetical protein
MRAGIDSNYVLVGATRVDDFFFAEAEFLLFILIHVPDIDPTGVVVTTDSGLVIEFDSDPGDDDWDEEVDFLDLASLRAAMDGEWTISISGPSSSESTFTIDAGGLQEADFYDTPTDLFPADGASGVPPDVTFSWSDPTGDATADILSVSVEGFDKKAEQEDDNIFGTLDIADTTWDPPVDLSDGFNEWSVIYLDIDDAQLVTPLVVQEGKIAWTDSPYTPKGYPAMTPLLILGSETIVLIEVGEGDTCPADLDDSGAVDFGDILDILEAWGNAGGPEDLDDSGIVDFGDILVVLEAWGPCP